MGIKLQSILLILFLMIITSCNDHQVSLSDRDEFRPPPEPTLSGGKAPSEIFDEVKEMFADIRELTSAEIEELNREELRELSMPLLMLWENTIRLNHNALSGVHEPIQKIAELSRSGQLGEGVHKELSREIRLVFSANRHYNRRDMDQELDRVREILSAWAQEQSKTDVCNELFNVSGSQVILMPGDNINTANYYCSKDTFFYLTRGTYQMQTVESPNTGNHWIGTAIDPVILDGQESTKFAFSGRMNDNRFSHFEIRNYNEFGIHFIDKERNENVEISDMIFRNIAGNLNGEEYGAIKTEWMKNLLIRNSQFENVTSAIRIVNSVGPLRIENNRAVNPGRNFFQCDKCSGAGIRITGNSMEHRNQFGTDVLEDYISLFQSDGNPNDRILVKNNRARGHAGSLSGSFIMLGDSGGSNQTAVNNIAVNPGQVGIGAAGGDNIRVEGNRIFGDLWEGSNVGIYSTGFGQPCSNHEFPGSNKSTPNRINWISADGNSNPAWTGGDCGIENEALRDSIILDPEMGLEIWDDWEPS